MVKYEDHSEDPAIIEAIINIKQCLRWLYVWWEADQNNDSLSSAISDLEQAVRFLEGKEEPT